jgi:hypothetical protein
VTCLGAIVSRDGRQRPDSLGVNNRDKRTFVLRNGRLVSRAGLADGGAPNQDSYQAPKRLTYARGYRPPVIARSVATKQSRARQSRCTRGWEIASSLRSSQRQGSCPARLGRVDHLGRRHEASIANIRPAIPAPIVRGAKVVAVPMRIRCDGFRQACGCFRRIGSTTSAAVAPSPAPSNVSHARAASTGSECSPVTASVTISVKA